MEERLFELTNPESRKIVIILDASESARSEWEETLRLVKRILQAIPSGIKKDLYFLGNPKKYDIHSLEANAGRWMSENSGRCSIITPVLQQIPDAKIVVIGSGILYDLEDWVDERICKDITFVRLRDSLRGSLDIGEEIERTAFDRLVSNLHSSILSVTITGTGFMPYYWDNSGYLLGPDGEFSLGASNLKDYSLRIACFGSDLMATVVTDTATEKTPLNCVGVPPDIILLIEQQVSETSCREWNKLNEEETALFKKQKDSEIVTCPECEQRITHVLRCLNEEKHGWGSGMPIYKSLKKILKDKKGRQFIIFKETPKGVFYKFIPSEIIRLDSDHVARNVNPKARILCYDPVIGKWVESKMTFKPYNLLREGYYVGII